MTIDHQLKDRFERETHGLLPEPDLSAAIAGGRRRRRQRLASYAVGSLAVAALGASLAAPHLGGPDTVGVDSPPAAADPVVDDGSFVPGTDVDETLQAAIAAALPSLPTARDVYASDWSRDTPLPDTDFADATEWQTYYDLSPKDELLVYVSKPIPGLEGGPTCGSSPDHCTVLDAPSPGASLLTTRQAVGNPGQERYWFLGELQDADGRSVNVIERIEADSWAQAVQRRVLTDDQLVSVALAPGLDFPDPVNPPPAS